MGTFISILIIAGVVVLAYFVGKEFESIAAMKGHCGRKYFWWTFLTGAIGIAMIIALPDCSGNSTGAVEVNDLPEI